ncbi:MAG: TIGR02281 family clan AA aspartic protease, partial [Shinella sp.]
MSVRSLAFVAGAVIVTAAFVPDVAKRYLESTGDNPAAKVETVAVPTGQGAARYTGNRSAVIDADPSGHFTGVFAINGRKEEGLVDTGASLVALNVSTAQRIG